MEVDSLRLVFFISTLVTIALLENRYPRRKRRYPRTERWPINLGLTFLNSFLIKFILGAAAVGAATYAKDYEWGLINYLDLSWPLGFLLGIVFLDFMIYLQHVIAHALPLLWRLHVVHHTDLEFDISTAFRFHPVEIIFSMLYKIMLVVAIGVDPWTVVIFEIVLSASPQFNHSNLNIPQKWDAAIRRFIVTPDMHRIHHSVDVGETNSNFGFFLSWWDKLCGTYRAEPAKQHTKMSIGIRGYRKPEELTFLRLLVMPLSPPSGDYSMKS